MEIGIPTIIVTDVLVVGSGGAALRAAVEAGKAGANVLLVSKSHFGYGSNTAKAGGMIAAATGSRDSLDSPDAHFHDTVQGGRFINHQKMAEVMTHRCLAEVDTLQNYGVRFRKRNEALAAISAPGHTHPRILITENELGTDFTLPLLSVAREIGCKFIEKVLVTRLLKKEGAVVGALGLGENGESYAFNAKATVLATGGMARIFSRTDNAPDATGDGMMLASEAGASLADMEFVLYYPTALGDRGGRAVGYEVLVAREGGKLRNALGEDILEKRGIKESFSMTRDVVARAVIEEIAAGRNIGGFVTLDLSGLADQRLERLKAFLPPSFSQGNRTVAVAPNAHFTCGGIRIDEEARTQVKGLFAAGEVCAGAQGANRIPGNALTEIFVFGAAAGRNAAYAARKKKNVSLNHSDWSHAVGKLKDIASQRGKEDLERILHALNRVMWEKAGPVRSAESLNHALGELDSLEGQLRHVSVRDCKQVVQCLRAQNMLVLSRITAMAAARRTESRGCHYRVDYPDRDDKHWLKNIVVSREEDKLKFAPVDVRLTKIAPSIQPGGAASRHN